MPAPVKLKTYFKDEQHSLMERTAAILKLLTTKNPTTAVWFNKNLVKKLEEISTIEPESGFHDLYLRSLFYSQLLEVISLKEFLDFPRSERVLVELLFNPQLESNLIDLYDIDFNKLLVNYDYLAHEMDSDHFVNNIECWENTENLIELNKHIQEYLSWFNSNKDQLKQEKSSFSAIKVQDRPELFQKLLENLEYNVEKEETGQLSLEKGAYLGTTGLFPCVAIITVLEKENEKPQISLRHSVFSHELYMEKIYKEHGLNVSFYLFGGLSNDLNLLLPLLYKYNFPIKEIRLASSIVTVKSCVVYYEDSIFIDVLSCVPSKINLINDDSEDETSDESSESEYFEFKTKKSIENSTINLNFFNIKRERSDFEQDENERELKKIKNDPAF